MYKQTVKEINNNFSDKIITDEDIPLFKKIFNNSNVLELLTEISQSDLLLEKISGRSYTHALGFDKIVLVDLSKDVSNELTKTQLRLHIWDPSNNALPMLESLHEHSFNFISKVLNGHIENQSFTMKKIDSEHLYMLEKLQDWIRISSKENIHKLDLAIEILESKRLSFLGSDQFNTLYSNEDLLNAVNFITTKTPFKSIKQFLFYIVNIHGHYVSDRITGERKAYKHILNEYVTLKPHSAQTIHKGEFYFHPYELPHRLFYDDNICNSTILVTTPIPENPKGGSLQRPTYVQEGEQNYNKKPISKEQLKLKLGNIISMVSDD